MGPVIVAEETRALLQTALGRIRDLKSKLSARRSPIAVVGLAGRFPGAANMDELWQLLSEGRNAIAPTVAARLGSVPDAPHHAALLDEIDGFDHEFFGVTPLEARAMDPQHRLLLEVSWEALEDAGLGPTRLPPTTGVFVGLTSHDYAERARLEPDVHSATGNGMCFSAGRLSHQLGLRGPSMCVDTACSSSLVAIHLAAQSLRRGESDVALAGACNLILSPSVMDWMARTEALSPSGDAATFDARANGYVRGEGCAVVVLKRLADAERDGDHVWAVVRGTAVNHDGPSSTLTAPNPSAQRELLRHALDDAEVDAARVGYVEAHGTGTPLGDPIEVEALVAAYGDAAGCDGRCYLGSVKTNIGHLEAAAGMAGLTRAVLALRHRSIPPQAGFGALNPRISLGGSRLTIPTRATAWGSAGPRVAGVSSFGMSGTNAHVVLEEAPAPTSPPVSGLAEGLLVLDAACEAGLYARAAAWADVAESTSSWSALCRAAARRHEPMAYRAVVDAPDAVMGAARLRALAAGRDVVGVTRGEVTEGARSGWCFGDDVDVDGVRAELRVLGITVGGTSGPEACREPGAPHFDTHAACSAENDVCVSVGNASISGLPWARRRETIAALHCQGVSVDWRAVAGVGGPRVDVPAYPWQRTRHFIGGDMAARVGTFRMRWIPRACTASTQSLRTVGIVGGDEALVRTFTAVLDRQGVRCVRIATPESADVDALVHLPGLSDDARLEMMLRSMSGTASLWVVTRSCQAVSDHPVTSEGIDAELWGIARAFATEQPERAGGIIDVDDVSMEAAAMALLQCDDDRELAFRDGHRYVPRLSEQALVSQTEAPIRGDGNYLVTGGTGGVGREVVAWLVEQGAGEVTVVSRRPPEEDGPSTVRWVRADVGCRDDVAALFDVLSTGALPLRGIFHAAGRTGHDALATLRLERYREVAAAKRDGARWLHAASLGMSLDCFVVFSSLAAVFAGHGQGAYAAANNGIDGLMRWRRSMGLAGTSIQWGLWDGPGAPNADDRARLEAVGVLPMESSAALEVLGAALSAGADEVMAARIDWSRLAAADGRPLHAALVPVAEEADDEGGALACIGRAVGIPPEQLDTRRTLQQLGLDSLGAVKLRRELNKIGLKVNLASLLKSASIDDLIRSAMGTSTSSEVVSRDWFVVHTVKPQARRRLFCFPYAGGGPSVFAHWGAGLDEDIEVAALQLPGRGGRVGEEPIVDMTALLDVLVQELTPLLDRPYAFVGHCFGSLLMYELAQRLKEDGAPLPSQLYVSGGRAPCCYTARQLELDVTQFSPRPPYQVHQMDDDVLVEALTDMQFASVEALADPDARRLLLPAVRADFALSNSYRDRGRPPLAVPIFAMGGRADPFVTAEHLLAWRDHTAADFGHAFCSGDHYFIAHQTDRWLRRIAQWA